MPQESWNLQTWNKLSKSRGTKTAAAQESPWSKALRPHTGVVPNLPTSPKSLTAGRMSHRTRVAPSVRTWTRTLPTPTDEFGVRDGLLQFPSDELLEVGDAAPTQRALAQLRLRQTQDGFGGQRLICQLHGDVPFGQGHRSLLTEWSQGSQSSGKGGKQTKVRFSPKQTIKPYKFMG